MREQPLLQEQQRRKQEVQHESSRGGEIHQGSLTHNSTYLQGRQVLLELGLKVLTGPPGMEGLAGIDTANIQVRSYFEPCPGIPAGLRGFGRAPTWVQMRMHQSHGAGVNIDPRPWGTQVRVGQVQGGGRTDS